MNMISSYRGPPHWLSSKESAYKAGEAGLIPGAGRSPEEEMATYSSILAWEIPWTEEPGRIQSMGSQRVGHDLWLNNNSGYQYQHSEGKGQSISKVGKIQSLSPCFSLSPTILYVSLFPGEAAIQIAEDQSLSVLWLQVRQLLSEDKAENRRPGSLMKDTHLFQETRRGFLRGAHRPHSRSRE